MKSAKSILVFGCGELQKSIIGRAHKKGLFVVGIDPCADAFCKDDVDAFEVVGGQDFEGTCAVVEKYDIDAIVTAATDKPLVMMARIADKYDFPFFSVDTARWSTDKFLMKERFESGGIPHARGRLLSKLEDADGLTFPVIVKPRDNSGSRGVRLCHNQEELRESFAEALDYSHLDSVLVEEFIEGPEYSIESLHHDGISEVIQFTEKKTTELPYNVELGHKQPANLTDCQKDEIRGLIARIGECLRFENCPSHTELRINGRGIFIIETSPRLGGDYITSTLVPLSTGINMEDILLSIALGERVTIQPVLAEGASGVCFFCFPEGLVRGIDPQMNEVSTWPGVFSFELKLKEGSVIKKITSSLDRYGELVVVDSSRDRLDLRLHDYENRISHLISIS